IDVRQNQNRSSLPWVPLPSTCGCCGRRAWRKHRSMDFELPEELRLLKATLRRFVDNELIPIERKSTDGEQIKPDYLKRFEDRAKELGIWQLDVPTDTAAGGFRAPPRSARGDGLPPPGPNPPPPLPLPAPP